jgi:hypothetical protein
LAETSRRAQRQPITIDAEIAYGELTLIAHPGNLIELLTFLRDDASASSSTSSTSAASTIRAASGASTSSTTCCRRRRTSASGSR